MISTRRIIIFLYSKLKIWLKFIELLWFFYFSESVTSTPQQTTGTMNSSELNSDKRKIFLPPTSLTSNTGTTCFIEPYLLTQRPPVSVDQLPKAQGIQDSVTEPQGRKMFVTGSQGREMLAKEPKDKESQTPPRALHHPEAKSTIAVPDVFQSAPAFTCPVCDIIFPSDYSDVAATEHVNSHFTDAPSHGHWMQTWFIHHWNNSLTDNSW